MRIKYDPFIKRWIDIVGAIGAIILLSPIFWLIIIAIKVDSRGNPIFRQQRIGKDFTPFILSKFRSMADRDDISENRDFDPGDDGRVTRVGAFLRRTKLDELSELFNVLRGDMSLVGPRPEVSAYVRMKCEEYKKILKVRPGLTDFASIKFRHEESILAAASDPKQYYVNAILPEKLNLSKSYIENVSFKVDFKIVMDTLKCVIMN